MFLCKDPLISVLTITYLVFYNVHQFSNCMTVSNLNSNMKKPLLKAYDSIVMLIFVRAMHFDAFMAL